MLVAKRYRLGPALGRGGMGEVFRATDEQLERVVAVKLLLPSGHDARGAARFQREARAAARLSDPHVVSVYDFGQHGDGFFLVMELVEGRTVSAELAEHGPLPKERAIDIIEQAAAGLAAAHREDVVHRDVKPGNLLLAADGTVKVADFGIAHVPGDGSSTLTATGQIIGSTHYLSPERARGGQAGKPSDVYALGCVLYQLVTGEPPFTAEHPTAILYQHVDTPPAPPSVARPELAGPFETVLLQMLAKEAADRPSAAEIATGALRAEPLGADLGPVVVPVAEAPSIATSPLEPLEPPNRMSRKTVLAGGIALLATAGAVVAGVLLNGNDPRLPPSTEVGPRQGPTSATPESNPAATSTASTTGPTRSGTASRANPTTPSQSASQPATSSSPTAGTTTTSPSASTRPSTTPSAPTQGTPSTGTSPSSTPPTDTPTPSAPASDTPSPSATGPAAD
ncbi:protein kinase [Kribbella sp. NBC_01510]|uniref:serine/threonine-protein kinase n=1 Tax=Kribbella sp. NBC_01510 TaxID=2903581 RepID=UPI00386639D6